jgi:CO/xanthine dehydrogenase FAD-binding subunit
MKYLPKFDYVAPGSMEELCKFFQNHGDDARILAGGTDLLLSLEKNEDTPGFVVDITRIAELSRLSDEGDSVFIGATATHTDLAESGLVRREALFLSEAAGSVGSAQIRNTGTLGGNIANASPAADTLPPLIALDAEVFIVGRNGQRRLPLIHLFAGPYRTVLPPHELLSGVRFPKLPSGAGTCFLKLGRRRALSISRISIAVALVLGSSGRIQDARICPGAVMPVPSRIVPAEQGLLGHFPSPDLFEKAGEKVAQNMVAVAGRRTSSPYKEPVVKTLVQRALAIAAERCSTE